LLLLHLRINLNSITIDLFMAILLSKNLREFKDSFRSNVKGDGREEVRGFILGCRGGDLLHFLLLIKECQGKLYGTRI
jgi:hypothetical protein